MDTLRGLPEAIETEFGESIVSRDEAIVSLLQIPGLGPPDLCWLQKAPKPSFLAATSSSPAKGYYHHVLGKDVSSSAAVAAYFAELTAMVEPMTFMQGLWFSSETVIERGFYCIYDPLSRLDIRCELCIPGGVVCGAVDAEGSVHELSPELWDNALLAGFLRCELLDPELTSHVDVLQRYAYGSGAAAAARTSGSGGPRRSSGSGAGGGGAGPGRLPEELEGRLLHCVAELYRTRVLPDALAALVYDQALGCTAEHMDLVLFALSRYFSRHQRHAAALDFFTALAAHHPAAAVYSAAAHRWQLGAGGGRGGEGHGRGDNVLELLQQAVEGAPEDVQLLLALGTEYCDAGQVDQAAQLARRAIQLSSGGTAAGAGAPGRPAWLLLSRCCTRQGQYALALTALNVAPRPPPPRPEPALLLVVPAPAPAAVTRPAAAAATAATAAAPAGGGVDVEAALALRAALEEGGMEGSPQLMALAGCLMSNHEPLDCGPWSDLGPLRGTRGVLQAASDVLQELVVTIGWDSFLELRARVFLMHGEGGVPGRGASGAAAAGGGSRALRGREVEGGGERGGGERGGGGV